MPVRVNTFVAYGHNPALSLAYSHGYSVHAGGLYLQRNRRLQEYSPQSAARARAHNTDRHEYSHTMHVTGDTDRGQEAGFTEKRERLAGWPISWFGTDARAPIAPPPMRVQHFG